ncbi:DUF2779 domain-containing protein [Spirochaeta dissipatitropha]
MFFSDYFADWLETKLKQRDVRPSGDEERLAAAHDALLEQQVRSSMINYYPEADRCPDPAFVLKQRLQSYRSDTALRVIKTAEIEYELAIASCKTKSSYLNRTTLVYPYSCWQESIWCSVDVMIPVGTQGWKIQRILPNARLKSGIITQTALFYLCLSNSGAVHVDVEFIGPGGKIIPGTRLVKKRGEEIRTLARTFMDETSVEYAGPGAFFPIQRAAADDAANENSPYHVRHLLRGKGDYRSLLRDGIEDIRSIPSSVRLSQRQRNQQKALIENTVFPDAVSLAAWCQEIDESIVFLDFESVQSSITLYPSVPPWQYVPVMYSISDSAASSGWKCLDPASDNLSGLADSLAEDLAGAGSIGVFGAAMELHCLLFLSEYTSKRENKEILLTARDRIVDLHHPFESGWVYFPEQKGKTSLKSLTEVLSPDECNDAKTVFDGRTASLQYYWQRCGYPDGTYPTRWHSQVIMNEIEQYSRNDTLYLCRLWELLRCTEFSKRV